MISRRFLLAAAPAALVAHSLPVPARLAFTPNPITTWGAGDDLCAIAYYQQGLVSGWLSVADCRRMEDLPDLTYDGLLRAKARETLEIPTQLQTS